MPIASDIQFVANIAPQALGGTGRIVWDVTGMASFGMVVTGTAVMTVNYYSTSGNPFTSTTSLRPWKTGASLGTNSFNYDSATYGAVSSEYRFPGGRKYLIVECSAWTSGSLTFVPYAIEGGSITYVAGGVQTAQEESTIRGNVFNAATSFVATAANRYLNSVFENPSGSGRLALIRMRRFSSSVNNTFGGISNPTTASYDNATAPTYLNANNLRSDKGATVMRVSYNMSPARIDAATTVTNPAGDFLLAYQPYELGSDYLRVVAPGQRFGHYIGGTGGGLGGAAANNSIYFLWEERELY